MKRHQYSIREINECLKTHEYTTRHLFNTAGVHVMDMTQNPGETVRRQDIVLLAAHLGGEQKELLWQLLREE